MGAPRPPTLALLAVLAVGGCAAPTPVASPGASASPSGGSSPASSATASLTPASPSPRPIASPSPSPSPVVGTWAALEPAGDVPSAREDHTWTVDADGTVAYLYGGRNGSRARGDLWAYDLATDTWRQLDPAGSAPDARFGHEAASVDHVGLVIFAGQAGSTFFDDLWAYDPGTDRWTKLPGAGEQPVARYGSCSALGPDGRLWISHGFTAEGSRFADTRAYDFVGRRWSDETPDGRVPVERCLHGCFWTDYARFVLYAGQTTGVTALGDLWSFGRGERWQKAAGDLPPARNLYAFARHDGDWIVFGGQADDKKFLADAWRLDGSNLAFRTLETSGPSPTGRSGATLIDDRARGRLLLFGGKTADGPLADVWQLSGV